MLVRPNKLKKGVIMKKALLLGVVMLLLASCGGGSGTTGGLNGATSLTGTIYSANGDPVSGATIYVPGVTVSSSVSKATRSFVKVTPAADGTTCEDPPTADSSLAAVCSGANGTFSVDTSSITTNPNQIVLLKGALRSIHDLSCNVGAAACALDATTTKFSGGITTWPKVAVVTGAYDRMEDVLAKIADSDTSDTTNGAYGRVNSSGTFVYGSEYGTNMTIINGGGSPTPTENIDLVTYKTWDKYLDGTESLLSGSTPVFDVVFIDCGNTYDSATYLTAAAKTILENYVNAGGRLYITDRSYDFINQTWPSFMPFEGNTSSTAPGDFNVAWTGTAGITLNAVVSDASMKSWLGNVTVNAQDASTLKAPDSSDCTVGAQKTGALNADGTIPIGDFLPGWARISNTYAGAGTTIISSGSGVAFDGQDNRILTASQTIGSSSGKIVYSSYHTADSCPTIYFWPQERVLQYLMFESF